MAPYMIMDSGGRSFTFEAETVAEVQARIDAWRAEFGTADPYPMFTATTHPTTSRVHAPAADLRPMGRTAAEERATAIRLTT